MYAHQPFCNGVCGVRILHSCGQQERRQNCVPGQERLPREIQGIARGTLYNACLEPQAPLIYNHGKLVNCRTLPTISSPVGICTRNMLLTYVSESESWSADPIAHHMYVAVGASDRFAIWTTAVEARKPDTCLPGE